MGLLFEKYATPFLLVDELISNSDFSEWIDTFIESTNEDMIWEMWLHKDYEKSFEDFKNSILKKPVTEEDLETTVLESKQLLDNFVPEMR